MNAIQDVKTAFHKSLKVAASEDMDKVDHLSADYATWYNESILPRTLLGGTAAMKVAGRNFLPQNSLETNKDYKNRLEGSTLLNAFRKTCSFLAGQVFQKDIIFSDDVPDTFKDLAENIDTKGNSINTFGKRYFQNGTGNGVSFILVDSSVVEDKEELTQKEEEERNIRPFFKEIRGEDVIGFRVDENGLPSMVRIKETIKKDAGTYGTKIIKRIRVLTVGAWELFEENKNGEFKSIKKGTTSVKIIPLVPFIPGEEKTIFTGETPLMDLAELNLSHWRSKSDQNWILHLGRNPLLFSKMMGDLSKLPISTSSMLNSDDENADMKFIEIQGASLAAGQTDITELQALMALYGLQQLIPRSGNKTATEKVLSSSESNSSLGSWVGDLESALQVAFEIMGKFIDEEFPKDGVSANKEYDYGIASPDELNAILKAVEDNVLSPKGAFEEFRRRGVFDEHRIWDDEKEELEEQARNDKTVSNLAGTFFGKGEEE